MLIPVRFLLLTVEVTDTNLLAEVTAQSRTF